MGASPETPPAIEVHHLLKRYPRATANAVNDVSFTVDRGEIFGLLGPNGAGKTTTLGILTTRIVPTCGIVRIEGIDVARDPIGVKQRISVVPQQNNLDLCLNVREILTFHASYHGIPRAERRKRADQLLNEFGLSARDTDKVSSYSGGMAQRVMIARAMMHTPHVLFLDEPTNHLDPQSRLFLWERIRALQERGISILLTTHDMEEASQLCDRIAIMDHGQILVCDTPAHLQQLIPGGTTLEVRIRLPEYSPVAAGEQTAQVAEQDASIASELQQMLGRLPGVTQVEAIAAKNTETEEQSAFSVFRLYAEDASALIPQTVHVVNEWNGELCDLHLSRPSMEDVFIYLTGRNLRS